MDCPDDSRNLAFLVLNYQMEEDLYIVPLSQTKGQNEHTLYKF